MKLWLPLLALFAPIDLVVYGADPSFSCKEASNDAEKAICASDSLMKLDRDMSAWYRQAKLKSDKVLATQKKWLSRRNLLKDERQLMNIYARRLRYLEDIVSGKRDRNAEFPAEEYMMGSWPPSRSFQLPKECPALLKDDGKFLETANGTRQVNAYIEATTSCKEHEAITAGNPSPKHDYLKDIDFWYLPLQEMPFINCDFSGESSFRDKCREMVAKKMHFNQLSKGVAYDEKKKRYRLGDQAAGKRIGDDCHLLEGAFIGNILISQDTVTCENNTDRESADSTDTGFSLRSIIYRDFNQDDIMDALLLIDKVGPGTAHEVAYLIVTRSSSSSPLARVNKIGTLTQR